MTNSQDLLTELEQLSARWHAMENRHLGERAEWYKALWDLGRHIRTGAVNIEMQGGDPGADLTLANQLQRIAADGEIAELVALKRRRRA